MSKYKSDSGTCVPIGLQQEIERLMGQLNIRCERPVAATDPRTKFNNVPTETIVAWMGAAESGDISAQEHLRQLRVHYSAMSNQVCVLEVCEYHWCF